MAEDVKWGIAAECIESGDVVTITPAGLVRRAILPKGSRIEDVKLDPRLRDELHNIELDKDALPRS